ncbi:hypothetical protein WG926_11340 [Tistrella sp. BH-R2-4]|jgi:hypothetical protein|uniref:Uncharacterized protein n=1 Tax=Tistrella arctica TaxID=3133430 RepID=A0ABU9YJE8_9PROT
MKAAKDYVLFDVHNSKAEPRLIEQLARATADMPKTGQAYRLLSEKLRLARVLMADDASTEPDRTATTTPASGRGAR